LSRSTQLLNISTTQQPSGVRLRFRKADHFATFFPLAAFLEQFDALETF
jgi:hypothetical protein